MNKRHHRNDKPKAAHQPIFALTIKETCKALGGITPPTVYKEIAAGRLKTFKIGNRRFSTPETCSEYIHARLKEAE
jgi:hypothetical protein